MRLTDEQRELQSLMREFCEKELRPIAAECDRKSQSDPAGCFPIEVLKSASRMGLRTLGLPRELGGRDLDTLTHCILLEEAMAVAPGRAGGGAGTWASGSAPAVGPSQRAVTGAPWMGGWGSRSTMEPASTVGVISAPVEKMNSKASTIGLRKRSCTTGSTVTR